MAQSSPNISCGNCPIRHNAVCAECDKDELAALEAAKSYRSFAAGEPLAVSGEALTHFSSIVSGCASMSRTLEDGRRQTVGLLLPSDFIGRPGRATAAYDVVALSDTVVCRFERRTFDGLVRDTPHIATRLLTMTLDELDAARDWAVVLGRMTAREKVAAFLVSLIRRRAAATGQGEPAGDVAVALPLSREAMSDHLGLTIETTSRQITAMKKDGLIQAINTRAFRIPSFEALALIAGEDDDGGPIA
ncbi:Crp/Fnr family transcriptional regulator [Palleronia sediminis]|uniref:Crp/Fnr family transcriptional regulator n=1 Tax=Palleronia sediminis TaxID=2547833 RepID=A0A4R6A9Y9_9RHOB|nr:Crp/Fnr family transcriptional regulator [Palleronia sediminis]TDL79662.1 Crp/Fnr family transcriptional regulator [Palleronia sediminis]